MTTVLLVDDDPENLLSLGSAIQSAGYFVVSANNGVDALFKLDQAKPRLIVTDWQMPDMDGLELCQAVRRSRPHAAIPIIMLSANVEPVRELGWWSAFFRKPVPFMVLLDCIAKLASNGHTTARAALNCGSAAVSRWQAVKPRVWP